MTHVLIAADELNNLTCRLDRMETLLIELVNNKPQHNPESTWTSKQIAAASGLNDKTVQNKINDAGVPKESMKPIKIKYKYIKELGLKTFNPELLK